MQEFEGREPDLSHSCVTVLLWNQVGFVQNHHNRQLSSLCADKKPAEDIIQIGL